MNKYRRRGITGVGGVTVGGLTVRSNIVGEKTQRFLQEMSEKTLTVLGPLQPSSDDIIFFTSAALSGVLIWLALPKESPPTDDTIL